MKVLLANIGLSDVQVKGEQIKNQRKECREYLDLIEEYRSSPEDLTAILRDFQLPLMQPVLEKYGPFDLLITFVTDQEDEKHRGKDTVETGKLVRRLLELGCGNLHDKIRSYDSVVIEKEPQSYDVMMDLYPRYMNIVAEKIKARIEKNDDIEIYINVTGGTPACNTALMFAASNAFPIPGIRRFLYVNRGTAQVSLLKTQEMISRSQLFAIVKSHIQNHDFNSANKLMELEPDNPLYRLLEVLVLRQNFEYEYTERKLNKAINATNGTPKQLVFERLQHELRELRTAYETIYTAVPKKAHILFNEIFWSMKSMYDSGHYLDFLGRFYHLNESLIKYEACRIGNCSISELDKKFHLDTSRKFQSRVAIYEVIRHKSQMNKVLLDWLQKGEDLAEFRHGTMVGHQSRGTYKNKINDLWRGANLFGDTQSTLEEYLGYQLTDPYEFYREQIVIWCNDVL